VIGFMLSGLFRGGYGLWNGIGAQGWYFYIVYIYPFLIGVKLLLNFTLLEELISLAVIDIDLRKRNSV
jgi:hypothetical protein